MHPSFALHLAVWLSLSFAAIVTAVEFKVEYEKKPAIIRYNHLFGKHELVMDLKITANKMRSEEDVTVTRLLVKTHNTISGATVTGRMSKDGTTGQLVLVCASSSRCEEIKNGIAINPSSVDHIFEFDVEGLKDGIRMLFSTVQPSNHPVLPLNEIVFQRHVDNRISFAQNWDTYVKGFGDYNSNYWMGLEQLSALTKDRNCRLDFEIERFDGSVLRSAYKEFQVRGADENYKLKVGDMEPGGQLFRMNWHSNRQFSTYDSDNDDWSGSCSSERGGNAGWWYANNEKCYDHNPNARIISKAELSAGKENVICYFNTAGVFTSESKWICVRRTKLSFSCN